MFSINQSHFFLEIYDLLLIVLKNHHQNSENDFIMFVFWVQFVKEKKG